MYLYQPIRFIYSIFSCFNFQIFLYMLISFFPLSLIQFIILFQKLKVNLHESDNSNCIYVDVCTFNCMYTYILLYGEIDTYALFLISSILSRFQMNINICIVIGI